MDPEGVVMKSGREDMVEGNDYEEFGTFGGYGALTSSFDIRISGSTGLGSQALAS